MGLVALDPLWSGEVVLVIRELYAFDQPFGKLLLRDGFTLVSSTVGDEELSSALLPEITSSLQVLVQVAFDTESAKRPIRLVVHKDRTEHVLLGGSLGEEAQPGEHRHTSIGKPDIRGLAAQRMHLRCSESEGDSGSGT